eukprot:TRINITY_DN16089_c0_g1_i1.p1 TRINITY_DN16089_c0_g1~~TRINITY_DN16089_c0_g1_i1.p1  ORF type:complete len:3624 (+),score=981.26 TRINITY_DN16089_c0_g1_i1:76-10947(+)
MMRLLNGSTGSKAKPKENSLPMLLHFDVNKTVIQSDSIQLKSCEEGVREGISDLYWGYKKKEGDEVQWVWNKSKPASTPPDDESINYAQWCKQKCKDKKEKKLAIRNWTLVEGMPVRAEMEKLLHLTMRRLQLPPEVRMSKEAAEAGLEGPVYCIFPALFHLVAHLVRTNQQFAILFRSFGQDHTRIQAEWNAFCEGRHPVFSRLFDDIGHLDGTTSNQPDRRIHGLHTLYRDAQGPVLILDAFTNGPQDASWDSWANSKPKLDTRDGRSFIQNHLKAKRVDGQKGIAKWLKSHLNSGSSCAIKDDWAWWQFHNEQAVAGKLMPILPGIDQIFFDDNIEWDDTRIVDCRDSRGMHLPPSVASRFCCKVNPVEALLDEHYFLRKLHASKGGQSEQLLVFRLQKQLVETEDEKTTLEKTVASMSAQLDFLAKENKRMKMQRRVKVMDTSELPELLHKDYPLEGFENSSRNLTHLFKEVDSGYCWLERNEVGRVTRVLDMVFIKLCFKDMVLIEAHEQDENLRVQVRNYFPGTVVRLNDTSEQAALERWLRSALGVDLKNVVECEQLPVVVPDAPQQQSITTLAYPMDCVVQHRRATFNIPWIAEMTQAENMNKIGLPHFKHFSVVDKDIHGCMVTRFYRWERRSGWESDAAVQDEKVKRIDVIEECDKLFKGHPRGEVYTRLLLEMFELFQAQKLCGGFSGSIVIRVQPFENDGRMGEACIVKLDAGEAIREEFTNSENVFNALPDRAARILGDAHYGKNAAGEEFGAMRLELAGACWNNPELTQQSNLLSTFKDLLLYESEMTLVGGISTPEDVRPFGNVNSVIAETFGPGGVVSSLRKGGRGLRRAVGEPLAWGWYTLKGKEGKFNPYTAAKAEYPAVDSIHRCYKMFFGSDLPNLKELVVGKIKPQLEKLGALSKGIPELCPLIGLAHGDLNAANIMIDALDAVWLIDFATSVDLPLFTDMCKFEMACLFEYSMIPITPKQFLEFCGENEKLWDSMSVGDWLRVDQKIAVGLLQRLVNMGMDAVSRISDSELLMLINDLVQKSGKSAQKKHEMVRALRARLTVDEQMTHVAMNYAKEISHAVLTGQNIKECLDFKPIAVPEGRSSRGASSLRFFLDICASVRRFMSQDIVCLFRDIIKATPPNNEILACDVMGLQLWLPFLRESYRIIGYRDIAPQFKVWSIYHCTLVAKNVQISIDMINGNIGKLAALPILTKVKATLSDVAQPILSRKTLQCLETVEDNSFSSFSRFIFQNLADLPSEPASRRVVRWLHRTCRDTCDFAGFYAPIWEVTHKGKALPIVMKTFATANTKNTTWQLQMTCGEDTIAVGYVVLPPTKKGHMHVVVNSPLVTLHTEMLKDPSIFVRDESNMINGPDSFDLAGYMKQLREKDEPDHRRYLAENGEFKEIANFEKKAFVVLTVNAVDGSEHKGEFELRCGAPACCYPPTSQLAVNVGVDSHFPAQIRVDKLCANGYVMDKDGNTFDPEPANHIFHYLPRLRRDDRILYSDKDSDGRWFDYVVVQLPTEENNYETRFQPCGDSAAASTESVVLPSNYQLNAVINSSKLAAPFYEEEVDKIKAFFRARYSFIIDALSGQRISVKENAPPTLKLVDTEFGTQMMTIKSSISRWNSTDSCDRSSSSHGTHFAAHMAEIEQAENGTSIWGRVQSTLEKLDKGKFGCTRNSFYVTGTPGSGKTCLVYRVITDILDRHHSLVPLLLPVADLVKRWRGSSGKLTPAMTRAWFDKYLRITFGEDSPRYLMLCQAMAMLRVVFLFEGLEEAPQGTHVGQVVESCIASFINDGHMVITTSRVNISSFSILEACRMQMVVVSMQPLSDEHKRTVAHSRLGLQNIDTFDRIFAKLRDSQDRDAEIDAANDDDDEKEGDVFGNPMMLSMLICYIQTIQKKALENANKGNDSLDNEEEGDESGLGGATLAEIYRVAIDVMLLRVQSKQQADRHNKEEKIDVCKQILNIMAKHMMLEKSSQILASSVDTMLAEEMRPHWSMLLSAAVAGHAMFLRTDQDDGQVVIRFLDQGFQNYFCSCRIVQDGGAALPKLNKLLTDRWWTRMLDMLAEMKPAAYVQLVESRIEVFEPEDGEGFLHTAARSGHVPLFQMLKRLSEDNKKAIYARNKVNQTPLHIAAEHGQFRICQLLIENGALMEVEDNFGRLPMHSAMCSGYFATAKHLMGLLQERPPNKKMVSTKNTKPLVEELAEKVLRGLPEDEFLKASSDLFVELGYFREQDKLFHKRTLGALLAVYWITANHYDAFVRLQPEDVRLTKASWENLQDWTQNTVKLTRDIQAMGAMLVFVSIMHLGKIKSLTKVFAPDFQDPDEALLSILRRYPIMIPSFSRLAPHTRATILAALKADFNFGQFLQAENLPASLSIVKTILVQTQGSGDMLGFFLFRIFAAMCGILGSASLMGSLFMKEEMYSNFKRGLDVLQSLHANSAAEVYDNFLNERAKGQGLYFSSSSKESRAQVRVACMTRIYDAKGGEEVREAFESLEDGDREELINFVNADGIGKKGFLLYNAPNFLEIARKNANLNMGLALRMLLRVYKAADAEFEEQSMITIMMDALVEMTKGCTDAESFMFTKFEIRKVANTQGGIHLSPWVLVNDKARLESLSLDAAELASSLLAKNVRESGFQRKLRSVVVELTTMRADATEKGPFKITLCGLLVIYWLMMDQHDSFTRGQAAEEKLQERQWNQVQRFSLVMDTPESVDTVLAIVTLSQVANLQKFRSQLAPQCQTNAQVMKHVLENCPAVLPTYNRLKSPYKDFARDILSLDFDVSGFLATETLPCHLTSMKVMYSNWEKRGQESAKKWLEVHQLCIITLLASSLGDQSRDGSLYLTKERWILLRNGLESISALARQSEKEVYTMYMKNRAETCGLPLDMNKPESVLLVRLACLCHVSDEDCPRKKVVEEAFKALSEEEQKDLAKYFVGDGMCTKALVARNFQKFLLGALAHAEVGLTAALQVMLKLFHEAEKIFQGSTMMVHTIDLDGLVTFLQEFLGGVSFQELKFELHRETDTTAVVIPKRWILVKNENVLRSLRAEAQTLAKSILGCTISERAVRAKLSRIFPELGYFGEQANSQYSQTIKSLLAIYWLASNQYDAFVHGQHSSELLSKVSWDWLQQWLKGSQEGKVGLSIEYVDALLAFLAVHLLGAINEFREDLAPDQDDTRVFAILAHVLKTNKEIVPSIMRLTEKYTNLILDCLSVDFDFDQFLLGENLPANLVDLQKLIKNYGEEGMNFFCVINFAQLCSKHVPQSASGCPYMTESRFQHFKSGFMALQQLRAKDSESAYTSFLLFHSSKALSRFAAPEHNALARLLCLSGASDPESGEAVLQAFEELPPVARSELTAWLIADGIKRKPGFVLAGAPDVLKNALDNKAVGLASALRMLLRAKAECDFVGWGGMPTTTMVHIHLEELASWAHDAGPAEEEFEQASILVKKATVDQRISAGDSRSLYVEVRRPRKGSHSSTLHSAWSCCDSCGCFCSVFNSVVLVVIMLGAILVASCLRWRRSTLERYAQEADAALPARAHHVVHEVVTDEDFHVTPNVAEIALVSVALICFLLLIICFCYVRPRYAYRYSQLALESSTSTVRKRSSSLSGTPLLLATTREANDLV